MTTLKFTKMQGLGNDFVVFDGIRQRVALTPAQVKHLADRRYGVGCDQVLVVENPTRPDVDFRYRMPTAPRSSNAAMARAASSNSSGGRG